MGILKRLSIRSLADRFGQTFKRFPLAMLLIIFLTGYGIYLNHHGGSGDRIDFFLYFYPATGALLAVALTLLTEDFKSRTKAVVTQVVVHVIWFGVSVYLAQFDRFSLPQLIAVSATVAAIGLAVFLICFYRKNQEVPFWNFSTRTVLSLAVAAFIGGVLFLGLLLLIESLTMLFGLHIDDGIYPDNWIICMVLLAPILFMILIPKGENKYLTELPVFSRFAKGVVQYLFLPLLGLYMITLYAYAAKILLQWSLPVGNVSLLVTGSMVLMVLLIYITFPIQHQEGNKLFKRVTRWLPLLMLPLLALMTVAIGRRLSDYGITVSRLYLLVFNLWCYAVCLWLIFTRNKRIWLIPASFAVILFLISVGPQSIANITQRQLLSEAREAFAASGFKSLPLTGDQYEKWAKTAGPNVVAAIDSKLDYLSCDFGYEAVSSLLAKDVTTGGYSVRDDGTLEAEYTATNSYNDQLINYMPVPEGYSRMTKVSFYDDDLKLEDNKLTIEIGTHPENSMTESHQFVFELKQLVERDAEKSSNSCVEPLVIDNGKAMLVVDEYNLSIWKDHTALFRCTGILFTK